jgi:hypothetical protein
MLSHIIKKVGRQQIKLITISIVCLFESAVMINGQVNSPDTTAFKRDFEKLLSKYGITNKGYLISVNSMNQKGGQTAFIINNNFYSDLLVDSANVDSRIEEKEGQKILYVWPKKGTWISPYVVTDSIKATKRMFYDPGIGVVTIIHGLSVVVDKKQHELMGSGSSKGCSKMFPIYIYLNKADVDDFYIFGDLQDGNKSYLFYKGVIQWLPMN